MQDNPDRIICIYLYESLEVADKYPNSNANSSGYERYLVLCFTGTRFPNARSKIWHDIHMQLPLSLSAVGKCHDEGRGKTFPSCDNKCAIMYFCHLFVKINLQLSRSKKNPPSTSSSSFQDKIKTSGWMEAFLWQFFFVIPSPKTVDGIIMEVGKKYYLPSWDGLCA